MKMWGLGTKRVKRSEAEVRRPWDWHADMKWYAMVVCDWRL